MTAKLMKNLDISEINAKFASEIYNHNGEIFRANKFHDPATKLYLYSDYYIADSYLIEKGLYKAF